VPIKIDGFVKYTKPLLNVSFKGVITKTFLPFKSWLTNRDMKNVSPLLIPYYYKMFSILSDNFINFAWKFKRFLKGKGFSLPKGS